MGTRLQLLGIVGNAAIAVAILISADTINLSFYASASIAYLAASPTLRGWFNESPVYEQNPSGLTVRQLALLSGVTVAALGASLHLGSVWPSWFAGVVVSECSRLARRRTWVAVTPEALLAATGVGLLIANYVSSLAAIWASASPFVTSLAGLIALLTATKVSPTPQLPRLAAAGDNALMVSSAVVAQIVAAALLGPTSVVAMRAASTLTAPLTSVAGLMSIHMLGKRQSSGLRIQLSALFAGVLLVSLGLFLAASIGFLSEPLRPYVALMCLVVLGVGVSSSAALASTAFKIDRGASAMLKYRIVLVAAQVLVMVLLAAMFKNAYVVVTLSIVGNAIILGISLACGRRGRS